MTGKRWNRIDEVVDNIFGYNVAHNIIHENEDYEPKSVDECRKNGLPQVERSHPNKTKLIHEM